MWVYDITATSGNERYFDEVFKEFNRNKENLLNFDKNYLNSFLKFWRERTF